MTPIADLFPYITTDSADMPTVMIKRHIADAARSFANNTGCIRETITIVGVANNAAHSLVIASASEDIAGVISVKVDGREVDYSFRGTLLTLTDIPTASYGLVIEVYTKPKHYAVEFSTILTDEYRDGLIAGTLFRIKKTGGGNWFDANGAAFNSQLLNDSVSQAKMDMINQKSTQELTVQPISFT